MSAISRLFARLRSHVVLDVDLSDVRFTADDAQPTDDYRPTCGTAVRAVLSATEAARSAEVAPRAQAARPASPPTLVPA